MYGFGQGIVLSAQSRLTHGSGDRRPGSVDLNTVMWESMKRRGGDIEKIRQKASWQSQQYV